MPPSIKYTLSLRDLKLIMKARQADRILTGWKRIFVRTLLLFVVMIVLSGQYQSQIAGPPVLAATLAALHLLTALLFVLAFELFLDHLLPRFVFAHQKGGEKQVELSFDEDRLHWSTNDGAGYLNWSSFTKVADQPEAVILFFNSLQAFILPLRAFADEQELEQTRRFIHARIEAAQEE